MMSNNTAVKIKSNDIKTLNEIQLSELNNQQLRDLLAKSISMTAHYLQFISKIWQELESRGEDLTNLQTGLTKYLPMISSGKLDPEVVIMFAGQQLLLKEVALMPIERQSQIVSGEKVPLVTIDSNDNTSTKYSDVSSLHVRHFAQVFDLGKVRTEEEQKRYLRNKVKRATQKSTGIRKRKVKFVAEQSAFKVGAMLIRSDDLLETLSIISGKSANELEAYLSIPKNQKNELKKEKPQQ